MMAAVWFVAEMLLLSTLLVIHQATMVTAGCADARLCCRDKENSCRVAGQRMTSTATYSNVNKFSNYGGKQKANETCFCDAGCLELGDCCTDYRQHCSVVDCLIGQTWSEWSDCSALCGLGVKERRRRVLQHPQNGGKPCRPTDLVQRAVCEGITCKLPRQLAPATIQLLREIGRIVPLQYASWRHDKSYSPYTGMRKHLYVDNYPIESPTMCATYEVTSMRAPCMNKSPQHTWTTQLKVGSQMCVECQSHHSPRPDSLAPGPHEVCRGRGVFNRETRWAAMTAPGCHGTWVMKTRMTRCSCNANSVPAFVFV